MSSLKPRSKLAAGTILARLLRDARFGRECGSRSRRTPALSRPGVVTLIRKVVFESFPVFGLAYERCQVCQCELWLGSWPFRRSVVCFLLSKGSRHTKQGRTGQFALGLRCFLKQFFKSFLRNCGFSLPSGRLMLIDTQFFERQFLIRLSRRAIASGECQSPQQLAPHHSKHWPRAIYDTTTVCSHWRKSLSIALANHPSMNCANLHVTQGSIVILQSFRQGQR